MNSMMKVMTQSGDMTWATPQDWFRYAAKASEVRFPKGRVTFVGAEHPAPFPVAVVVFRPRVNGPREWESVGIPPDRIQ